MELLAVSRETGIDRTLLVIDRCLVRSPGNGSGGIQLGFTHDWSIQSDSARKTFTLSVATPGLLMS